MFGKNKEIQKIWSKFGYIEKTITENNKFFQSNLDKFKNNIIEITSVHAKRLAELKQYVECSVCGSLVSKEKAKVEWEMREKYKNTQFEYNGRMFMHGFMGLNDEQKAEKEAVKKYKCLHCQTKGKRK